MVQQQTRGGRRAPTPTSEELRLAAELRHLFREAQLVMSRALAESQLSEQRYHLLLAVAGAGQHGLSESALADELHSPDGMLWSMCSTAARYDCLQARQLTGGPTMAGEKKRGAPKRQQKKPSSATKQKAAKKLAARIAGQSPEAGGLQP